LFDWFDEIRAYCPRKRSGSLNDQSVPGAGPAEGGVTPSSGHCPSQVSLSEAEPLYRRALAIDEKSYGPDHPTIAIHVNNLALLLAATNRPDEAEPLFRRSPAILEQFTRATGHQHPHLDWARANYVQALKVLGRGEAEVEAALRSVL
jgi:hypothetical protein